MLACFGEMERLKLPRHIQARDFAWVGQAESIKRERSAHIVSP